METEKPNKHPKYGDCIRCDRRSNGRKRKVIDTKRCLSFIRRHGSGYDITGCWLRNERYQWYSHHIKFFKVQASRRIRKANNDAVSNGCWYKKAYNYGNIVY